MAARRKKDTRFAQICRELQAEAAKHPEPNVCHSFQEYRWQLDHGFGGYAPRAGEINLYEEPASGGASL